MHEVLTNELMSTNKQSFYGKFAFSDVKFVPPQARNPAGPGAPMQQGSARSGGDSQPVLHVGGAQEHFFSEVIASAPQHELCANASK